MSIRSRAPAAMLLLGSMLFAAASGGPGCGIAVDVVDNDNAASPVSNINANSSISFDCGCLTTSVARNCETAVGRCLVIPESDARAACFEEVVVTYRGLCGN